MANQYTTSPSAKSSKNGSTNDSMTLYLNPMSLAAEGDNTSTLTLNGGNFSVADTANYYVTHLRFGSNISNGNEFLIDEFPSVNEKTGTLNGCRFGEIK